MTSILLCIIKSLVVLVSMIVMSLVAFVAFGGMAFWAEIQEWGETFKDVWRGE